MYKNGQVFFVVRNIEDKELFRKNHWEEEIKEMVKFPEKHVGELERYTKVQDKKILEIGSGCGTFLIPVSYKNPKLLVGIEPDKDRMNVSALIKKGNTKINLVRGVGENIPFIDNSFDIIWCYRVLEHTKTPYKIIKEMVRVLNNNGVGYISIPNYLFPFEEHYKIFMIPFLPKKIVKAYIKILGKNPEFIDHINLRIYSFAILRYLRKFKNIKIRNITEEKIKFKIEKQTVETRMYSFITKLINQLPFKQKIISYVSLLNPNFEVLIKKVKK